MSDKISEDERTPETEKICFNCNAFLPATMKEPTEFGICLNDEAFDAFGEELLEDVDCAACRPVVEQKKFEGDRPACPDFQEAECIEIDDDSPLGRRLRRLADDGELTSEALEEVLLEEGIRRTDWTTLPVETYAKQLEEGSPEERKSAMKSLEGLAALGNEAAFDALRAYLASLPPTWAESCCILFGHGGMVRIATYGPEGISGTMYVYPKAIYYRM